MNAGDNVFDASGESFVDLVVEASREIPVLVDFWAEWCGPCRALTPMLMGLADEFAGRFRLAKVNTELEPRLAADHGIRALPTVTLFRDAMVVEEFSGLQPESFIRSLLEEHLPRASDAQRERAGTLAANGDAAAAIGVLRLAVQEDPANHRAQLDLCALLVGADKLDEAEHCLRGLPANRQHEPEVQALHARLRFARIASEAPALEELTATVESDPRDCEARYQLCARRAAMADYAAAMAGLLEILRRDRTFRDDAARKGLLAIFEVLGSEDPLVKQYQSEMALVMY